MKYLYNDKGIALVTSLMLTLLTLTISMVMLYMVLQSTQLSGAHKRYKNSLDAAVGGVEIVTMEALPYLLSYAADPNGTSLIERLKADMPLLGTMGSVASNVSDACLQAKLTTKDWGAACGTANSNINATDTPDITFTLRSQVPGFNAPSGFRVYTKIVATTPGSTDLSGRNLDADPTTGPPAGDIGSPYLYRIEVTGEKIANPLERANLSVLYAY